MKTFMASVKLSTNESSNVAIEHFYESIIEYLNTAAAQSIVAKKVNFFKFWWDAEGDALKESSIHTHKLWKELGRPKVGDIYLAKTKAKFEYKSYIANKTKMERSQISNSLHDALLNKDNNNFWHMWKSKFGTSNRPSTFIEGSNDNKIIADKFATFFSKIYNCTDDNIGLDTFNTIFERRFSNYCGDKLELIFDIATVDDVINNLKKGKASGGDNISCEHFKYAHPIVCSCVTMLFNMIIAIKYVPVAFGQGIIVPIPKGDMKCNQDKLENYRGITISCIMSKIFESCILCHLKKYFLTSDRQFGFKKNVGCSNAIYSLRKTIEYFNSRGSTVNICSMDLSKAFDKINFNMLFNKLMDRKVPRFFIEILISWYEKLNSVVRWNDVISNSFNVTSGVRQGGILSPILFAVCVDDLLTKLGNSKMGCFISALCCNSFMYADDLILLSITVHDLQSLVDISADEITSIGLNVNCSKTFCIRIGSRHTVQPKCILIHSRSIAWVSELRYLGVSIVSSKNFKVNMQNRKQKFFRALNAIFSKIGGTADPSVIISIVEAYCVPILLYGLDCIELSSSLVQSLENAYSQLYSKLFHSFDKNLIRDCQFYSGQLPVELKIANRRFNFLKKINLKDNTYCKYFDLRYNELSLLINKYCSASDGSNINIEQDRYRVLNMNWKSLLRKYFERSVEYLV